MVRSLFLIDSNTFHPATRSNSTSAQVTEDLTRSLVKLREIGSKL